MDKQEKNSRKPAAPTGNASNPSPGGEKPGKAEKYLRESGNIEDMPDPQEQQEAEEIIKKEKQK